MSAYQEMISSDSFPMYALFIDLDPSQVDINVHPTKQEIKFEDEKIVYAFVQAAVKHALAQFSITPTIDFELDPNIQKLDAVRQPFTQEKQSETLSSPLYRTFTQQFQAHKIDSGSNLTEWKSFFKEASPASSTRGEENYFETEQKIPGLGRKWSILEHAPLLQVHQTYIIVITTNGYILLDQQAAHERILYERYLGYAQNRTAVTQKNLFPISLQLNSADAALLQELLPDLSQLGYEIELFGKDSFIIHGGPADIDQGNEKLILEKILEQFKHFNTELRLSKREKLIRSVASQQAIRKGITLGTEEMKILLADLFNCDQPNVAPNGDPVYIEFKMDYLHKLFQR
jgi:DNA mismatch repair protein MutL